MLIHFTLLLIILAHCHPSSAQIPASPPARPPGFKYPDPNPWTDFCQTIGYTQTASCGNFMYPGGPSPNSFAAIKAATKCAAEIDKKSAEAAAIYRFLGTDPADMIKYASGSGIRLSREGANGPPKEKWWWDGTKQKYSRSDYTPEDRERARALGEGRIKNAVDSLDMALKSSALVVGWEFNKYIGGVCCSTKVVRQVKVLDMGASSIQRQSLARLP